jgi:aminoglycoside phosphotransferase (APT) family kinase protein
MSSAFDEAAWRAAFDDVCAPREFVAARPLAGGVSAETVEIRYITPAGMFNRVIGRRHGAADLARNPRIAYDELRLLELLREAAVPAPVGIGVSDRGILPNPVIITSFVEGSHDSTHADHIERAADLLARIHRQPASNALVFLRRVTNDVPPVRDALDDGLGESRIRAALATVPPPESREAVLLHGDFWPGNLLWQDDGQPVAIDWEDAATGDPLYDLANARLEWRLAYSARASARFTRRYRQVTGRDLTALPWWDLRAALKLCGKLSSFGPEPQIERRWRAKHRRFVNEAIGALASPAHRARDQHGDQAGRRTDDKSHHQPKVSNQSDNQAERGPEHNAGPDVKDSG